MKMEKAFSRRTNCAWMVVVGDFITKLCRGDVQTVGAPSDQPEEF